MKLLPASEVFKNGRGKSFFVVATLATLATGKTPLALQLAERSGGNLVAASVPQIDQLAMASR